MMINLISFLLLAMVLVGCSSRSREVSYATPAPRPGPGVFFVATNGNDQWSGSVPLPVREGNDGPFASVTRALKAAREARQDGKLATGQRSTIFVCGGTYFLEGPVVVGPDDSNLLVTACPNTTPVLSGGRPITGWKETIRDGRKLWSADVPEVRDGKWMFRELWVNGQRAKRARHPNRGYLAIGEVLDRTTNWFQGQVRFRFKEGDLKAWNSVTNAEVLAMTRWVESRLPITGVDEKERLVTFGKRSVFELWPGDWYFVEGAYELLDEPGEWYLDSGAGTLYYLPRAGEALDGMRAVAPRLAQVLRLEGIPEAGKPVQEVTFCGLTFAHTEWFFPAGARSNRSKATVTGEVQPEIGGFAQAAIGVPGAVWGEGVRRCTFDHCRFSQVGNYGLELTRGCQANRIRQCEFSDLGAGGIKLGETRIRTEAAEQTGDNEVIDCHIHDGGLMFASAIGVWIGHSSGNRLVHNLIHDFYYTGISVGWTWGYGPAVASNNAVLFNHIHHIGVKSDGDGPILSDMGGIYTLGRQPGMVIRSNLWHDMAAVRYGGWGIYFDEGSSGIVAEDNLVYRTTHGGFHQHYGETNTVRNNIFAFARDHQIQRTRPEPHVSFTFVTNIVYFDSGTLFTGSYNDDQIKFDWNDYFDARPDAKPEQPKLGPAGSWQKWRERGQDVHSLVADPKFLAPKQDDFRLQPDSPSVKLGFRPFDLRQVCP